MQKSESLAVLGEPVDFLCSGTLLVLLVLIFVLALLGCFVLLGRELDKRGEDEYMVKITRVVDLRQQREGSALYMVEYQDSATGVIGGFTEYVLPGNLPKAGDTFDELGALYKKCRGEK